MLEVLSFKLFVVSYKRKRIIILIEKPNPYIFYIPLFMLYLSAYTYAPELYYPISIEQMCLNIYYIVCCIILKKRKVLSGINAKKFMSLLEKMSDQCFLVR